MSIEYDNDDDFLGRKKSMLCPFFASLKFATSLIIKNYFQWKFDISREKFLSWFKRIE